MYPIFSRNHRYIIKTPKTLSILIGSEPCQIQLTI
jgi:hypothetical protein